jgi:hypothetical protein
VDKKGRELAGYGLPNGRVDAMTVLDPGALWF